MTTSFLALGESNMAQYDLIIRNGTIVDGSGAPGFLGDIAVKDGVIAAVGTIAGTALRTITRAARSSPSALSTFTPIMRGRRCLIRKERRIEIAIGTVRR
jgi:hypothetical protein